MFDLKNFFSDRLVFTSYTLQYPNVEFPWLITFFSLVFMDRLATLYLFAVLILKNELPNKTNTSSIKVKVQKD